MKNANFTVAFLHNETSNTASSIDSGISLKNIDLMKVINNVIASVGIISNLTVVIILLNDRKLRRKIPNMFVINQVSVFTISQGQLRWH